MGAGGWRTAGGGVGAGGWTVDVGAELRPGSEAVTDGGCGVEEAEADGEAVADGVFVAEGLDDVVGCGAVA